MRVEAGLITFLSACFEVADEVPEEAQHGSLAYLPKISSTHLHDHSKGYCCGVLRVGVSSPPLFVTMIHSSQPPHQAPRTKPVLRAGA